MNQPVGRRKFLGRLGSYGAAAAAGISWSGCAGTPPRKPAPPHPLTTISGTPRERGRQYGRAFRDPIRSFLDTEIYQTFTRVSSDSSAAFSDAGVYGEIYVPPKKPPTRDDLLRFAGACAKEIRAYSPTIHEELEGMAEGTGLRLEEIVLVTLHEELGHGGALPHVDHCTAIAAGPPDTADGHTYVGQNWDWMESVHGLSSMLLWKRPEGPSVLAYSYPGLWAGAGMNSAGVALCWTSGAGLGIPGPRVGIPSYVLIAQMLYQDSLQAAVEEARRAKHAGWFVFVLADGEGRLANVEGTPRQLAVEFSRGHVARWLYGTAELTRRPDGQTARRHPRCQRMYDLLGGSKGRLDRERLQRCFADHQSDGKAWSTVCTHFDQGAASGTVDSMLFDTTKREAYVTRGPACSARWKTFRFDG